MISKKARKELLDEDENIRIQALDSIKSLDSKDIDFIVQTAWGFDQSYLQKVVQRIAQVRDQRSALAIGSILFASTEKSQEPIRTQCIEALSQNPTDAATNVLVHVAKNQRFYKTQCDAIKKLGSKKKRTRS